MSALTLRPWTDLVRLHPDVESGTFTEATFAIDLGAVAAGSEGVPAVYRDPEAFFRATYLTADLRKMLEEVLSSLGGRSGYNRVLKLRTPFGGGKSHTLAALLHGARCREALQTIPEGAGLPDPGPAAVAVFDGEKFDARDGKTLEDGRTIRTMWGWMAWQIDPERAFPLVEGHDRDRTSPGGEVIARLLTEGAGGRPVLLLFDEVLKYMERAGAVGVLDSTLRRQAMDFFHNLTVEVANSSRAAMVYSLQWSAREAMGNIALLQELDQLASRVDQLREPVSGDEILPILQRRLLGGPPEARVAAEVAEAYAEMVAAMRQAYAETPADRQQAAQEGIALRDRTVSAYPFHPALIDVMRERWMSMDAFQHTRGALRFLATCLYSLKKWGGARPLLGSGDVPLQHEAVRINLLKELGVQNSYDAVIRADIDGPNARAPRIDDRLGREMPALTGVRPATRLATAILLCSFGGLRRAIGTEGEALPPGVTEAELLAACAAPDLDSITAAAVLGELRQRCLYLHYDGSRYAFKTEPNINKLIEDAAEEVAREETQAPSGPVKAKLKELLGARLAGHHGAEIWPSGSAALPDKEPRFLVGYLPLEFAAQSPTEQERQAKDLFTRRGDDLRRYKNGIGLAIPDRKQVEPLRRAVRYVLATERVESQRSALRLTPDLLSQLREQRRSYDAAAESALRELYNAVWLPRMEAGQVEIEKVEVGGRPLQATGIHERVMELLTSLGTPKVYSSVTPRKIGERLRLGEVLAEGEAPRLGIRVAEVVEAFYRDLEPPRLESAVAIKKAVARGVAEQVFGYTSGYVPGLGADGKFQVSADRVAFGRPIGEDEVDLETGFLILPAAIPQPPVMAVCPRCGQSPCVCGGRVEPELVCPKCGKRPCECNVREVCPRCGKLPCVCPAARTTVSYAFRATRDQLFNVFAPIANLADKADDGRVTVRVEGRSSEGYDPSWLRNAVEEPLDEANVEREE